MPEDRFLGKFLPNPKLKLREQLAEGTAKVEAFLTHSAVSGEVSPSTQNQALNALLFLYGRVLEQPLTERINAVRASRPARVPEVLTPEEARRVMALTSGVPQLVVKLIYGSGLRLMEDGSYVWAYWPPLEGEVETYEDISHAAINVDFMVLCHEHGIVFTHDDMARLEKTLFKRVLLADDRISDTVGGGDKFNKYPSAVLRWGRLGRHFREVRERLLQFSRVSDLGRESTALPLGIAYLSLSPAAP